MPDDIPQPPALDIETSPTPKDLRAELEFDLKSEFTANLSAAKTLPKTACDSLVSLLGARSPIPADVIAALILEDPAQPEVPNG